MGEIIFKIILIAVLVAFLVFMWFGDRRNRLAREAEEREALEAEERRREEGAGDHASR